MGKAENDESRENRLRRTAPCQGYSLVESRSRDPRALHVYAIIDSRAGSAFNALRYARWPCSWDPDFVEGWLASADPARVWQEQRRDVLSANHRCRPRPRTLTEAQ